MGWVTTVVAVVSSSGILQINAFFLGTLVDSLRRSLPRIRYLLVKEARMLANVENGSLKLN